MCWGFASLAALLPGGVINLIKLLPRTKEPPARGTRKGQPRTVQIVPVSYTNNPLKEWESEGRRSEDPYRTSLCGLTSKIQAFGVPGVSLALRLSEVQLF
jgi:hypothetical protein